MDFTSKRPGWHPAWEQAVYAQGRHLNRYPLHAVVGLILSNYGNAANRAAIKVLELGCGAGNNLWFAAREGFGVAGIDGSKTAIEYARQRLAQEGLSGDLRVGDFASLPLQDATFDMVLDRCSLTHTTSAVIRSALRESRRVLKPGGKLLSICYSDRHPARKFGRHIGDNTYVDPDGGCFSGLGQVHFAPLEEVCEIFGKDFTLISVTHSFEESTHCLRLLPSTLSGRLSE